VAVQTMTNSSRLVRKWAVRLFDGIVKTNGLASISVEEKITDLLFSLTTLGTQDHTVLEDVYFKETEIL
jgi:hypothetical protein